jgi:hypothetical protein
MVRRAIDARWVFNDLVHKPSRRAKKAPTNEKPPDLGRFCQGKKNEESPLILLIAAAHPVAAPVGT